MFLRPQLKRGMYLVIRTLIAIQFQKKWDGENAYNGPIDR